MPSITVIFERIDVDNDGEPLQKGKLYWNFAVNGSTVTSRSSSNPTLVGSGGQVTLNQSHSIERDSNDNLTVSGFLAERDSLTSGKDDRDDFSHTWTPAQGWGEGARSYRFTDRKLDCTLHYTVEVD